MEAKDPAEQVQWVTQIGWGSFGGSYRLVSCSAADIVWSLPSVGGKVAVGGRVVSWSRILHSIVIPFGEYAAWR